MKFLFALIPLMMSLTTAAQTTAQYKVQKGSLHKGGKITVTVLPDTDKYKVEMKYDVEKKALVPVPGSLLKGKKAIEFPQQFRTAAGYKDLESKKEMEIPKAVLKFVKRADYKSFKDAYFIEVHPTNKKSKIDIIYHPSLPSVGWARVQITFISNIPVLSGYELIAEFKN